MCIVASTKAFSWSNNHPLTLGTYTDDVSKNIKMQWNDWKKNAGAVWHNEFMAEKKRLPSFAEVGTKLMEIGVSKISSFN